MADRIVAFARKHPDKPLTRQRVAEVIGASNDAHFARALEIARQESGGRLTFCEGHPPYAFYWLSPGDPAGLAVAPLGTVTARTTVRMDNVTQAAAHLAEDGVDAFGRHQGEQGRTAMSRSAKQKKAATFVRNAPHLPEERKNEIRESLRG